MTVVCYKDGILAADSAVQSDGYMIGTADKVAEVRPDAYAAASGLICDIQAFLKWRSDPDSLEQPEMSGDEFLGVEIGCGDAVWYGECLKPYTMEAPFWAFGSGAELALGAMLAGATAEEACRIACEYDSKCGLPVVVHKIGDKAVIDMTPHMLHRSAQEAG